VTNSSCKNCHDCFSDNWLELQHFFLIKKKGLTLHHRCIYNLTEVDYVKDEALLGIGELHHNDDCFGYDTGNYLVFKSRMGI